MKEILAKADELGKLVAASPRFAALRACRRAIQGEHALRAEMQALREMGRRLAQQEQSGKPVTDDQKAELMRLQESITSHPKMQELARAEADFSELMNRVKRAMYGQLTGEIPAAPETTARAAATPADAAISPFTEDEPPAPPQPEAGESQV